MTDTAVAPVDDHDIVTLPPTSGLVLLADMLAVGAGTNDHVTVTESVLCPPGVLAVILKVSLPAVDRVTDRLPEIAVLITVPSRVTDTDVAPVDDQLIVTLCPTSGLVSLADMLARGWVTETAAESDVVLLFASVIVTEYVVLLVGLTVILGVDAPVLHAYV